MVARLATLVAGVLGLVLPNISSLGLSGAEQAVVTAVGGSLLAVLAWLEHPTTKTAATTTSSPAPAVPAAVPAATAAPK